jgi:hypothetical protein
VVEGSNPSGPIKDRAAAFGDLNKIRNPIIYNKKITIKGPWIKKQIKVKVYNTIKM